MKTLPKYKQNLKILDNKVWSYSTVVAIIDKNDLIQHRNIKDNLGRWSQTTQKHINYVADYLDLILINES